MKWVSWNISIIIFSITAQKIKFFIKDIFIKGALMQIWNSANIFVFLWKYVEDFTLKHLLLFKIWARETCEKFVYKHTETIEYVKSFKKLTNFTGK